MDILENLFPVIILLIIIITTIFKRKKAKDTGQEGKPSLWKQVVSEIMEKVEVKQRTTEARMQPVPDVDHELILEDDDSPPVRERVEKRRPMRKPPSLPGTGRQKSFSPKVQEKSSVETSATYNISDYSINDLQKAVVLSEILGSPLALREEKEER